MSLKVYIVCEESREKGSTDTNNIVAAYATRELAEKRIKECKKEILKKWSKIIDFNDGWTEEVDESGIYTIAEITYYEYYYTVWIDEQDVVGDFPVPAPTTSETTTSTNTTDTTDPATNSTHTNENAYIPQLRTIETSYEAFRLIDELELDNLTWVVYAAICIENGIDYNSVTLIECLEDYTRMSYRKEFALLDDDFSYLYVEIDRALPENPTTMDIYKTVLKKQAENKMLYTEDIFARIFCYEHKVLFDKDEFMKLHSKTKE